MAFWLVAVFTGRDISGIVFSTFYPLLFMVLKYRPDIDGLRAIAVLAVLFFHTGVPGFGGGFVGVDVFFVISGFLITSIILKDIKHDGFSIARFYERRIRRIFPALFAVLVFTVIVGAWMFDAPAFSDLGKSVTATTLFSSNIFFWSQAGYFDAPSLQKPLLHTWSLAVEEQFYIFFPLALAFIHKRLKSRYLPWVLAALALSLGLSIWGVYYKAAATFFLVPTRAWELLVGSVIALGVLPNPSSAWVRNFLSITGLGMILYSVGFYTEATRFPGYNAIAPVLGAGLVIRYSREGDVVYRFLAAPPMMFIGLISYSLYLWHWPLVVFSKYLMFRQFGLLDSVGVIVMSLLLGFLSWRFIERPFRDKGAMFPDRNKLFAVAGAVMLLFIGTGGLIALQHGLPGRFPEVYASYCAVEQDSLWLKYGSWETETRKIGEGTLPHTVGVAGVKPSFAFVGDSHAQSLIAAIDREAVQSKRSGYVMTLASTPFLLGVSMEADRHDDGFDEVTYNDQVLAFIKAHPEIRTVIMSARWGSYVHGHWTEKGEDPLNDKLRDVYSSQSDDLSPEAVVGASLKRTVKAILAMNRKVILVSDVPEVGYEVPRWYSIHGRFPTMTSEWDVRPTEAEYHQRQHEVEAVFAELERVPGVCCVHPESLMFDEHHRGRIVEHGELLYRDDDHLSTEGALYIAPAFDRVFEEMDKG
jgi:peptidoglycan/LPS O-acetylase OafA/YrhL